MPEKVTKDFIHIPAKGINDSDFVADFGRMITIDKDKGIKANIGKLKSTGKTRIRSYFLPTKSFTKAQARDWVKSHSKASEEAIEMKDDGKIIQEEKLTRVQINNLPDSAFLYIDKDSVTGKDGEGRSMPTGARHLPYKNELSEVNPSCLRNALQHMNQLKLSEEAKRKIIAKSRIIAEDAGMNFGESFLDEYRIIGPLFHPYLESTLAEFNDGTLLNGEYDAEEYDMYGRKLARMMNSWIGRGSSVSTYDENGNPTLYSSSDENESESEWEYHDGLVVRSRTSNDNNYQTDSEYSVVSRSESDDELITGIAEAQSKGGVMKSLRMKKKMRREGMASKINLTSARLREIEDGDDYDDDELGEIAKGLGISKQKLSRVIDAITSKDESANVNGIIKIIDKKIKIIRPPFTIEKFEVFKAECYPTVPKHIYAECGYDKYHELIGVFIQESIKEEKDGALSFSVPLFKENELTHNNNRYTTECSENLLRHLGKLNKKNSTLETSFLDALKESVGESSNAAYVIESMKQQPLLMLASHEARQGKGNFLKDVAGRVLGGRREKIESDMCFVLEGKTIRCPTGDQIAGLMREGVMRGVSLFSYPFKFEDNKEGAHDVSNMLLVGTDFTNEGGNLRHFKDKSLAAPTMN